MTGRGRTYTFLSIVLIVIAGAFTALTFAPSTETKQEAGPGTLTARTSQYGRILFDSRGFALYGFTADRKGRSVCSGACAEAWPLYIVKGHYGPGVASEGHCSEPFAERTAGAR